MKGLQPPPKEDTPSRVAARMIFLLVMLVGVGVVVYTAVTNQNADLTEDIRTAGLELDDPIDVSGITINVSRDGGQGAPVVFLHDVDVTGGLLLEGVSQSVGDSYRSYRLDMAGFGYSDRLPFDTQLHTAAGHAEILAEAIGQELGEPAILVGVGFGGKVAAEIAHSYPEHVAGVVLVDTDLSERFADRQRMLMKLPWVGKAATYTWETGGRFAQDDWSPYCELGGWCPSLEDIGRRNFIVTIENTTESLYRFSRTEEAALAPSNLTDISAPMVFVWSKKGPVEESVVHEIAGEIGSLTVLESDSYQAHLEDFVTVRSAIDAVAGS